MTFAEKLIHFRADKNISQAELAKILQIHPQSVYNYENEICKPTKKNLIKYNEILDKMS